MPAVRFFAPDTDAFVDSVQRHAEEFTSGTGIQLNLRIIPSDEYFSNDIRRYLQGDDCADVFMSGPVLVWEHIGGGLVEPLDEYVSAAPSDFDPADFFPSVLACNRWSGKFGGRLGQGPLWEIPVNCESYNLAFPRDALEKYQLEVPATWDAYFEAARTLQKRSGGALRGFAQRGVQVWHTMYTGYATQFWAWGATDFDSSGRCAIASAQGVAATTAFLNALKDAGPSDWLNQRWYELAMDVAGGSYGLIVDSDHYVAYYEMGEKSAVKGRMGYALPPTGPAGRVSNLWTWSLVMNARSRNKQAAWRFIEWADPGTSRRPGGLSNGPPGRSFSCDPPRRGT